MDPWAGLELCALLLETLIVEDLGVVSGVGIGLARATRTSVHWRRASLLLTVRWGRTQPAFR